MDCSNQNVHEDDGCEASQKYLSKSSSESYPTPSPLRPTRPTTKKTALYPRHPSTNAANLQNRTLSSTNSIPQGSTCFWSMLKHAAANIIIGRLPCEFDGSARRQLQLLLEKGVHPVAASLGPTVLEKASLKSGLNLHHDSAKSPVAHRHIYNPETSSWLERRLPGFLRRLLVTVLGRPSLHASKEAKWWRRAPEASIIHDQCKQYTKPGVQCQGGFPVGRIHHSKLNVFETTNIHHTVDNTHKKTFKGWPAAQRHEVWSQHLPRQIDCSLLLGVANVHPLGRYLRSGERRRDLISQDTCFNCLMFDIFYSLLKSGIWQWLSNFSGTMLAKSKLDQPKHSLNHWCFPHIHAYMLTHTHTHTQTHTQTSNRHVGNN